MTERNFPSVASRIEYWNVDHIDYADPTVALPKIDRLVAALIERLRKAERSGGTSFRRAGALFNARI